jgi:hypothetical protein
VVECAVLAPSVAVFFDTPKVFLHYNNVSLGHNKLRNFMTEISRAANLSKEYTNHSCRATTVHVLDEAEFPSRHIMSITGHKSIVSINMINIQFHDQ